MPLEIAVDQHMVDVALDGSWRPATVQAFNDHFTDILQTCKNGGYCAPNADKLVILAAGHFRGMINGRMQGESVWCDAVVDAVHALGYSMLMTNGTVAHIHDLHRQYHPNIQLIFWNNDDHPGEGGRCLPDPQCAHLNPETFVPPNATHSVLPAWKIFTMHWWRDGNHPLCVGKKSCPFSLSPEPYPSWNDTEPSNGRDNYYLGYSLEKTCMRTKVVPHAKRKRQVYLLSKRLSYFLKDWGYFLISPEIPTAEQLKTDFFSNLTRDAQITFLASLTHDVKAQPPAALEEIPRMNRPAFQAVIANSLAVQGIGFPPLSPSPWEALCLGVPFINPVVMWNRQKPDNVSLWHAQQSSMLHMGIREPYVYHVKIGDRVGFELALTKAINTPIDRYIPPYMKMSALLERTKVLLETDWVPVAEQQIRKLSASRGG